MGAVVPPEIVGSSIEMFAPGAALRSKKKDGQLISFDLTIEDRL
jgi:hypothetical protein